LADPYSSIPVEPVARRKANRLHEVRVELEVPFHDVDALQIVWHGHYYKYFEIARTELLRSRGLDGLDLYAMTLGLLVIESHCRHVSPLHYGDRFEVAAWFRDLKYRVMIDYEITNLTRGTRAARAHTALVTTTANGTMHHRTPDAVLAKLAPHLLEDAERS
jgi:acyl-CoA thioester hydrolase